MRDAVSLRNELMWFYHSRNQKVIADISLQLTLAVKEGKSSIQFDGEKLNNEVIMYLRDKHYRVDGTYIHII